MLNNQTVLRLRKEKKSFYIKARYHVHKGSNLKLDRDVGRHEIECMTHNGSNVTLVTAFQ